MSASRTASEETDAIVLTTPSAAMAPSTPRIGPMQHATHVSAAIPTMFRFSRGRPQHRPDDLCGLIGGIDLEGDAALVYGQDEGEQGAALLFGGDDTGELG